MQIIWFRNDLRLSDNPVLAKAIDSGEPILPVYILDPFWFGKTEFGFPRCGDHRIGFLRESIEQLAKELKSVGSELLIFEGNSANVLVRLADQCGAQRVICQRLLGTEECEIESEIGEKLKERSVALQTCTSGNLYDKACLPFDVEETPDTFTKFRKTVEMQATVGVPIPAPTTLPAIPQAVREKIEDLDLHQINPTELAALQLLQTNSSVRSTFQGGEQAALSRLKHYFWESDGIRVYKETRNGLVGLDYSSKFSPWLALGCISARSIVAELERYEAERTKNDSTYWMFFELLWREYFQLMLGKYGTAMFTAQGLRGVDLPWGRNKEHIERWINGETGLPFIDANMRELKATGFMSNRGRQNVASFLTKNLGIDWRIGAEWFESQLIDYDPASNYGNWNYAAGVGNDPRGFRWFNTMKQAAQYDPQGAHTRIWIPELADYPDEYIHQPWELSPVEQRKSGCVIGQTYPNPIVDLFQSADRQEALYNEAMARQ